MKNIKLLILLFVVLLKTTMSAQNNNTPVPSSNVLIWKNAILRSDGQTSLSGVEAFCAKTNCQGDDYILIKFKNNTNAKVSVEWVDAIWVNQNWYYPINQNPKKFYIDANSTVEGVCGGEIKLQVKINSIINDPLTFEHYTVSGLVINK